MSLILDALRKLEREKDAREPAVLIVGSVPWGGASRARRVALAAGAALALGLAVLLGWLLRASPQAPAAVAEPPRVASPLPVASPSLAPAMPPENRQPQVRAPAVETSVVAPPIRLSRPLPGERRPAAETEAAPAPMPTLPSSAEPAAPSGASGTEPVPEASLPPISTAPAASQAPGTASDELRLNAISQRDGRPVALINDRLVFEGDSFEGVRVLRIGEAEVEVEVRGQRRVLRF